MTSQFGTRDFKREVPGDFNVSFVTSFGPGKSFFFEEDLRRNAPVETLPGKGREFKLDPVKPTGMFGCINPGEPLSELKS